MVKKLLDKPLNVCYSVCNKIEREVQTMFRKQIKLSAEKADTAIASAEKAEEAATEARKAYGEAIAEAHRAYKERRLENAYRN